jgi:hypothetical protein
MDLREYLQGTVGKLKPKFQRTRQQEAVKYVVSVVKSFHDKVLVHCDIKSKSELEICFCFCYNTGE